MRKKLLSILVLSIVVASTVVGCSQACKLTVFSTSGGNISVMQADTGNWIEAQIGMSLEPGDIIKTGDNSSTEITFLDGSTIELQAGTEIEVVSLNISTDTGSTTIRLKQIIGSIIFRVIKLVDPASRYEVETPTGAVAIRGSAMQVYVIEDGTTWVTNLEGDIWAIAQGVELQIPEGQQCIIRPGQPPELIVAVCNLTISSTTAGSVTIPGEGAFPYNEGTVVELVAEAEEGYQFGSWTGDVGSIRSVNAAATTITMQDNYAVTANFEEDEVVTFPDPNLEAAVREDIAIPTGPIYASDLDGLTDLYAEQRSISNLSGLEHCTSLIVLHLHDNQISDISPLVDLTNLTSLRLMFNQISDISSLANLTDLTFLQLDFNQISDISPLVDLTNLAYLGLTSNQISDISPLANLTNLVGLTLDSNQISDISSLASLANLVGLTLDSNQISDISSLANLINLVQLGLWSNQISDISLLANLTNLTELGLTSNQISDISPLANLTDLTFLDLGSNQISDISPLADLTSLTQLNLGENQISDVSPLADLTKLTYLGLWSNQISDISPLANLTNLTYLGLVSNHISDISPLANLANLTSLNVELNQISDISSLVNLTNLTSLVLLSNQISNISSLANLTSLTYLHLGNNQISDISPLLENAGLSEGDYVILGGNPLSSDSINIYIPELEARGVDVGYQNSGS